MDMTNLMQPKIIKFCQKETIIWTKLKKEITLLSLAKSSFATSIAL